MRPAERSITKGVLMNNELSTSSENVQNEATSMADLESYENSFKRVKVGEFAKGSIESISPEGLTVNIGGKTDGFMPAVEINNYNPADFTIGEEIEGIVVSRKGEGEIVLSKKRADREAGWKRILEAQENGEIITATCTSAVKGGIIVDLGVRGFVPASQVNVRPVKDLNEFVGEELKLRIIEIDREKRKVVLSRKSVIIEERKKQREEAIAKIKEGEVIEGEVARITDFGAFVNLGGIDGLIHISEMSWKRIKHPSEVISIGEKVKVLVLKVSIGERDEKGERKSDKIALSLRQAKEDPWATAETDFPVNSIVEGKITKLAKRYAFVEVTEGIEGLIPISEIAIERINAPEDVLKLEQVVKVKVKEVKATERRMLLSIKAALPEKPRSNRSRNNNNEYAEYMEKGSSATIGDILKSKNEKTIKEVIDEANN